MKNIIISNIVGVQYCDRYYLKTLASGAYLDCYYNDKGIYTNIIPNSTLGEEDTKLKSLLLRLSLTPN